MLTKLYNLIGIKSKEQKDYETREYAKNLLMEDLKEYDSPIRYNNIEYYNDVSAVGYLPIYLLYDKERLLLLYNEFGTDYIRIRIPEFITYKKQKVHGTISEFCNEYSFSIEDILLNDFRDFDILNFIDYHVTYNNKVIYASGKNKESFKTFFESWNKTHIKRDSIEPYVN